MYLDHNNHEELIRPKPSDNYYFFQYSFFPIRQGSVDSCPMNNMAQKIGITRDV